MPAKYVHPTAVHFNGNLLCAVDTETTGLDPENNSIIELCILPLLPDYSINKKLPMFNMLMQPIPGKKIDQEALQINKIDLVNLMTKCLDAYKVADLLVDWFDKLNLGMYKRIVPLAQNWPFDRGFLISWLGAKTFELLFDKSYRDTMTFATSLNDRADMRNEKIPFPKQGLKYLCTQFGIVNPDPHRALGDCVTTAEVYKNLLKVS